MEELGRSLENLNKALVFDNALLEALFNRALAAQYLTLYGQAEQDWREISQTRFVWSMGRGGSEKPKDSLSNEKPGPPPPKNSLLRSFEKHMKLGIMMPPGQRLVPVGLGLETR